MEVGVGNMHYSDISDDETSKVTNFVEVEEPNFE